MVHLEKNKENPTVYLCMSNFATMRPRLLPNYISLVWIQGHRLMAKKTPIKISDIVTRRIKAIRHRKAHCPSWSYVSAIRPTRGDVWSVGLGSNRSALSWRPLLTLLGNLEVPLIIGRTPIIQNTGHTIMRSIGQRQSQHNRMKRMDEPKPRINMRRERENVV